MKRKNVQFVKALRLLCLNHPLLPVLKNMFGLLKEARKLLIYATIAASNGKIKPFLGDGLHLLYEGGQ